MNYLDMDSEQLINELLKRDADIQALRKDAERYRWLRDTCGIVEYKRAFGSIGRGMLPSGKRLDMDIDAAMETRP